MTNAEPVDTTAISEARRRIATYNSLHAKMLQGFWDDKTASFGLEGPLPSGNVTTSCTCALSLVDVPQPVAADFFSLDRFATWLLGAHWATDGQDQSIYTLPIALTTAFLANPTSAVQSSKVLAAQHTIVSKVSSSGAISWSPEYPPHAFYSYWSARSLLLCKTLLPNQPPDEQARTTAAIERIGEWAESALHHQFSYSTLRDFDHFDSLHLAYLLATLDLLDSASGKPPNPSVLKHGLLTFFDAQLDDGMWSRGLPLFHTARGTVYPFAIEVLTNLVRLGSRPYGPTEAGVAAELFIPHLGALLKVLSWIDGHYLVVFENLQGWRSNAVLPSPYPQAWSTAAVLAFLNSLDSLLAEIATRRVLASFGSSADYRVPDREQNQTDWNDLLDSRTRFGGTEVSLNTFLFDQVVVKHLTGVSKRPWSIILAGPPGVAKTTLAQAIANAIGWPLLGLTTADFLANGFDQAIGQTRSIFKELEKINRVVVFIDEVEEFVRDREGQLAERESRLWTTAMLTLLQNLNRIKGVLLILATNYLEQVDRAISRPGRFDVVTVVLPPPTEIKVRYLREQLKDIAGNKVNVVAAAVEAASELVDRMIFLEWDEFVDSMRVMLTEDSSEEAVGLFVQQRLDSISEDMVIDLEEWDKWKDRSSRGN